MAEQPAQHRFLWEDFELDLRLRRLLRAGRRIRLQPIPMQILTLLLERPGEVVTRNDLHHKIWNGYSYGDFDHSLNIAINKLRSALGDSAKGPRYIETLPQVGYRFLAPVESKEQDTAPAEAATAKPGTHRPWLVFGVGPLAAVSVLVLAMYVGRLLFWPAGTGGPTDQTAMNQAISAAADRVAFVSAGPPGTAFRMTGTGADYVRVPNKSALEPERVTVTAWVRANGSPGTFRYVLAKGALSCDKSSYALYTSSSGGLVFYVSSEGLNAASPSAPKSIWDGEWHHVAGTFDGAFVRLFVDGEEVGRGTAVPAEFRIQYALANGNDLTLGAFVGNCVSPFRGEIGDVEVFGRGLQRVAIQGHYQLALRHWRDQTSLPGLPPESVSSCLAPVQGLVAWWPGEGPLEVVAGLPGTVEGEVITGQGKVGPGLMFFGHGHVVTPVTPQLQIAGPLTLEAWVYFQGEPVKTPLGAPVAANWADVNTGTVSYGLFVRPDGVPYLALSPDGVQVRTIEGTLPLIVQFTHVAGVWDGKTMKLYINGSQVAAAAFEGPLHIGPGPFTIGGLSARSVAARESMAGVVDEVSVYARALSEKEILAIYQAGSAGKCRS